MSEYENIDDILKKTEENIICQDSDKVPENTSEFQSSNSEITVFGNDIKIKVFKF